MAELFVYAAPHWMDSKSDLEKAVWSEEQWKKWDRRFQVGDIFAVFPDGYTAKFGNGPIKNPVFAVIRLPGVDEKTLQMYTGPSLSQVVTNRTKAVLRKCRYSIPANLVPKPMEIVELKTKALRDELMAAIVDKAV